MTNPTQQSDSSKVHYCQACKKPLRRISGKMGPFWGCTGFPLCKFTLNDVNGKPSQEVDEHYRCPVCTRRLVLARPDKGNYWYCSGFSKGCKVTLDNHAGIPQTRFRCRSCGHLLVQRTRKNTGTVFWGCSEYPECTTTYSDKDNRPDFDIFTTQHS